MQNIKGYKFQTLPVFALAITFIVGGYFYEKTLDNWLTDVVSGHMLDLLKDVEYEIKEHRIKFDELTSSEVDDFLDELPQVSSEKRFTIIGGDGTVLGDSNLTMREITRLEDHSQRPEVASALDTGFGVATRFSTSTNRDLLFVAIRIEIGGKQTLEESRNSFYILRGAMPMTSIDNMARGLRVIEYLVMFFALLVLIVSTWVSQRRLAAVIGESVELQEEKIKRSTREIELLRQLANTLAACTTIEEAQTVVRDIAPRVIGDFNGCVSIVRESRNLLEVGIDWGGSWPASTSFSPHDCWALRKGKYHISREKNHNLDCHHMGELCSDHTTMCIPLIAHGNTVGVFHLYFADSQAELDRETKNLVFTLAEHLGLALANLRLQEELRSQAMRDPLTGLYNRRYFEDAIDREYYAANQNNSILTILMLDLDHFKRFNDNFGHDAGDFVLKEVSSLFSRVVSDRGIVCRIGGEEFVVVSTKLDAQQALALSNRIIEEVRELHLSLRGISLGQLGVSVGIATYPELDVSEKELIKLADTALYEAKERGRSQAVYAGELMKQKAS